MTRHTMDVLDPYGHAVEPDLDFLREALRILAQAVMDAEVTHLRGSSVRRSRLLPER